MLSRDISSDLAAAAADLLDVAGASEPRSLNRLVSLAARQVPGCSGAAAVLWRDGEPVLSAASHPDLSDLSDLQLVGPGSPALAAALADGESVDCPDTLDDRRWPGFASAALSRGVRSWLTLVRSSGPVAVTLTLFSTRPRVVDPGQSAIGELLVAFGGAVMGNASAYSDAQRTAHQLREAADSRALVDQAKGVLMAALGCTADEALRRMRDVSQTSELKVTDVARTIIESRGAVPGQAR